MKANELKATDLMVGDFIACPFNECSRGHRVDYINEMEEEIGADGEIFSIDGIKPIPLTPELLEKNGFYFGYTSNEEDLMYSVGHGGFEKHWTFDEGTGSIQVLFHNGVDGGEIILSDQDFNKDMHFVFCDTLYVHKLQHTLKLCGLSELAENFKI